MTVANASPAREQIDSRRRNSVDSVLDASQNHRHDLDGLRAFAIALVVAYHVWVGRVSGGVDVFLLLSAFFMTGSLVRKADRGHIGLGAYWVNRFWRLVPIAALTIVGVLVAAMLLLPSGFWPAIWDQAWASLFYYQNVELAANAVDYYARGVNDVSPLLHFWSLSVQGQIFILWPLILLACWGIARWTKRRVGTIALVVFSAIFVASFIYSIWLTDTNQTVAYYSTPARMWEFAIGSIVALIPLHRALPRVAAEIVGWGGIAALLVCGMVIDVSGGFPGYLAMWPVLAAVAVIIGGATANTTFAAVLGSRFMRWMGTFAYPLYLVHWPILVFFMITTDTARPDLLQGGAIVAASIVLAIAIRYGIDRPLQRLRFEKRNAWAGGLALIATASMVVVPLTQWQALENQRAEMIEAAAEEQAAELAVALEASEGRLDADILLPIGSRMAEEWVGLEEECTGGNIPEGKSAAAQCSQTIIDADAPTFLIVGDSHAQQWMGAFAPLAVDNGYNVVALLRGGCPFALDEFSGELEACNEWRGEVTDYINETQPDVLFTVGTRALASEPDDRPLDGIDRTLLEVEDAVGQIILVRDNPRYSENIYSCVFENLDDGMACAAPLQDKLAMTNPVEDIASDKIHVVDMTEQFCPEGTCRAVIGNTVLYMDDNHITKTFMQHLIEPVGIALDESGFRW